MNLKLNNEVKGPIKVVKSPEPCIKDDLISERAKREEERRRTGRYMAILVGISLFILAIYHAWVRRIPIVASLVVPALIMFVYVAWILYTASREKHRFRLFDLEIGPQPDGSEGDVLAELTQNNVELSVVSKDSSNLSSPEDTANNWSEISSVLTKGNKNVRPEVEHLRLPIILVNDKPPKDLDQKWLNIIELSNNEKLKILYRKRRFKRRFCRRKRHAAPKRSYSIG